MIKRIKRIKNLGIFADYAWDTALPDFKRYNIIYGWNGCGKTTFSSLFQSFRSGQAEKFLELEYDFESTSGTFKQGTQYSREIRVFNQDYIAKNVQLLSGTAKSIYILGEENKKIIDKIEFDEKEVEKSKIKIKEFKENYEEGKKDRNKRFTDIARIISSNSSGEATRRYDRRDAEEAFNRLIDKELLTDADIKKHNLTLRQLEKALIGNLNQLNFSFRNKKSSIENVLEEIGKTSKDLCVETVETIIIDRLKGNHDISRWVEDGIAIHSAHESTKCEFCNQTLPENRISELTKYFNEADKRLKDEIDMVLAELRTVYSLIDGIRPVDKANLYEEIQVEYQSLVEELENEKKKILGKITEIAEILKDKKMKTTESLSIKVNIDATSLVDLMRKIDDQIVKHNNKTSNFKIEKKSAQKALESHYLSTIFDEIKVLNIKIKKSRKNFEEEIKKLTVLNKNIVENKSKISSSHKACKSINDGLATFLGRDEISFEVEGDGYVIKRNGKIATNLSEGEKTAIAFVYFTVHLQDQDFNIKEGILVVDDPISSLDSNSLFQAFSFLKNAVKDARQVFILTHNFDFLKLLLYWLKHGSIKSQRSLYMITNPYVNGERIALITKLDKTLEEHESEYHYLFKKLYTYVSDGADGTIESAYNMPNMSRKLMETFLMFRVPNNQNYYDKLETLKNKSNDKKLTAIYKFTNDQSHITGSGFDPSLVSETQKNIKYLLELIQETFPEHYQILKESISNEV